MAIITFLSDFGMQDHYVAAVKAQIFKQNPNAQIIDISHNISLNNVIEASFVLKNVYKDFPEGTVHLIAVNENHNGKPMAIQLDGHYFVGRDSGIFGLLSDKMPTQMAIIPNEKPTSFSSKNVFAKVAVMLSNGANLSDVGTVAEGFNMLKYPQARTTKNEIGGQVMHVDGQGNLISNITRTQFEEAWGDRHFEVSFERERLREIHDKYTDVDSGNAVCFFNDNDMLEIAVNDGNACKLFGLSYGANVKIYFRD